MSEVCGHGECSQYGWRKEYCALEAADPEGDVLLITDIVDDLLHEPDRTMNEQYNAQATAESVDIKRTFSYLHGDQLGGWAWPLAETHIALCHRISRYPVRRETYVVSAEWKTRRGLSQAGIKTTYTIDIYPEGSVQAIVEELDTTTASYDTRSVTGYDYAQLFELLTLADTARQAEKSDNSRALR